MSGSFAPRPHIIVTRRLPRPIEDELSTRWSAVLNPSDRQFTPDELVQALQSADVVLCTLTDPLTRAVFEAARPIRTRLLANFGVGFNHIDLDAARDAGIPVTNTPGVLTEDTADLTMLLILAAARRASEGARELREGGWTGWRPTHLLGTRVTGKRLGIVGFGRIGQAVARRAHQGFGMEVFYHSRRRVPREVERDSAARYCAMLDELLGVADFVSLHCPATPETRHLIGREELARMQTGAFLINTSRGDVVDEPALVDALRRQVIAGAALDVFEHEPAVHEGLLSAPTAVLLPHLGSATMESRVAMGRRALANIEAFLAGQPLPDPVT
jgi:lactate dehydrogenase-like 2-hydroxyacid dehydrogenase